MKKLVLLLTLFISYLSYSQLVEKIEPFRQFNGRYDFTAFGNTMNKEENPGFCEHLTQSSATFNLGPGVTLHSAHLYWAGSGTGDFQVKLNGADIIPDRTFALRALTGLDYFSAYKDVSDIVRATGNGTYTLSELDISAALANNPDYCDRGSNFAGWSIIVIFEDPSLRLNQITLFDGLEYVDRTFNDINLVLKPIDASSDIASKIGFLAWEGDRDIEVMESLLINDILIDNPPLNPGNNAFNGTNTYTGAIDLFNMDLDFYDLEGLNIVQVGDVEIDIKLGSGQDFIMVNNVIVGVNSELPDATIEIDALGLICENGDIDVEYTAYNVNSTNELPTDTKIAFYSEVGGVRALLGQTATMNELAIGGSESGTISLRLPPALPNNFDLVAVIDDIGDGTGQVNETDETNNEDIFAVDKSNQIILIEPGPACIGAPVILDSGLTNPPYTKIYWFDNGVEIGTAENQTTLTVTTNGIYTVQAFDGDCEVNSFDNPVIITFRPQPVANPAPDIHQCDFGVTLGTFTLTDNDDEILGTQNAADFPITYYTTREAAELGVPGTEILGGVHNIQLPSPQTIYARIADRQSNTCYDITEFKIFFNRAIAGDVSDARFCDDDGDGQELVDLEAEFNPQVLDGNPASDYTITYHATQGDADNDTGALAIPHLVSDGDILFIRLENNDDINDPKICVDTSQSVTISIDTPPTVNTTPPNLIMCDDNNDGFATFDLSLQDEVITMNDPSLIITYHGTLTNAQNGDLELPNFYINDRRYQDFPNNVPGTFNYGTGGVWARVTRGGNSCVVVVPFGLEVRFSPVATQPGPLRKCDDAVADGVTRFDLTVVEPEVLGALSPTGFDLYYFEEFTQAVAAGEVAITNPDFSQAIPDPTNFFNASNPQTIYILVVSNATGTIPPNPNSAEGCYDIVELQLFVDPLPEDFGPFEYELCDDELQGSTLTDEISTFDLTSFNTLATNNNNDITVVWFEGYDEEIADTPIPNPDMYQNTETPQTVIGRVTSEFGCKTLVTLTLTVLPNPNPNMTPTPLELCDNDIEDDGIASGWDPSLADTDIIFNEQDVIVRYFVTEPLAIAGAPGTEITPPFTNTVPDIQTIYARVEKEVPPATLACYTIVPLELHVIALPDKPQKPKFSDPLIGCDETASGTAIFDLTRQDDGVIGDQVLADFAPIKYYEDQALAIAGAPGTEISPANSFIGDGTETIWVRLESLITGCVRITPFELDLELFPTIGVGNDIEKCDDLINGSTDIDGISTFDLTVNDAVINMGNPNIEVFYYATPADQANNTPIANPSAYQNIQSPRQTILVTGFSENGCRAFNSFEIIVLPTPEAFSPGEMIACDSDYDGFADFDLPTQDDFITNNDGNLSVSYHETLLDAQNNVRPILVPYPNDVQYNDVPITDPTLPDYGTGGVWARVTTNQNDCHRIISFALRVHAAPRAVEPGPLRECDDDGVADGFTTFNLTDAEAEILGALDPAQFDVYYYENLVDAQTAGDLALGAPNFDDAIQTPGAYTNTANPQTIFVLVVGNEQSSIPPNPNGAEGCYDIVELQLIVDPVPANTGPFENALCDDEASGSPIDEKSFFDLTANDFLITGGVGGLTVTWFEANGTPIPTPEAYLNIATPQTVIGTVTSEFGCSNNVTVTLKVLPNPDPKTDPEPITFCDEGIVDDGIVDFFDLTVRNTEIIDGQENVSVLYYETKEDAIAGLPGTEIVGPYTNTTPFSQIVYARVTNDVPPRQLPCFTIVELELIVVPLPDRPDDEFLDEIFVCDEDGNGMAIFDLTIQDESVYGLQDPDGFEPISYHIDENEAIAGINAIDPADAFESISRTIWVRLESLATGCARITPFEIIVGEFPGSGVADDLVLCDDEVNGSTNSDGISTFNLTLNTPKINNGDPTLTVLYYASLQAQMDEEPIENPREYQNEISPVQEIFVTVLGQNSCKTSLSFTITVNPNPEPVPPTPLFACDVDNNGITFFDLESKSEEIRGTDPTLIITYHETMFDARTGDKALTSPYENIILFNQTVYVRAAYNDPPDGTGCYTIVTLELVVNETPVVPQDLPDLIACEDDGTAEFDLTQQEELIFGTQAPEDYTLRYYLTQNEAIAGGNGFIADPEFYTNIANPQTIWVRLQDNETECYKISSFNLIVNSGLPIVDPTELVLCDDLGEEFDGITTFDLTVKNGEITNGVVTQGVSYFITEEDAQANENRIDPDTAYVNEDENGLPLNPQVLYVRVQDSNSECISFTTLTIKVISNPNPIDPEPIELCDVNVIVPPGPADEVEIFDLTIREAQILNGNNWDLGYYESYDDAINEVDEILAPELTAYQNTSNPQIIYVRTTNPTSLCFEIVELELIVNPLPDDTAIVTDYIECALNGGEIAVFNLETKVEEILGGQPQASFEVSFYIDEDDAKDGINAIVNTTNYQNKDANNNAINPQTIFTGITNIETGCYIGGEQSFELIVQDGAFAVTPIEPFVICDNTAPSDGFAEFDLDDVTNQQVSDLRAEILGGQDPTIFEITFHQTLEEAEAGIDAITFPYTNIINPQRIYVRVTNTVNIFEPKCAAVVELIIKVEHVEDINLDGDYRICVDENGNPIAEDEGGPSPPVIDTGLDPALYTFQWDLDGVILVGETGPSIIALQGGVYTVTYTELASNCEFSVSATVTVSSPPFTYEANLINGAFAGVHVIEVIAEGEGTYQYQLDNGPFQDSNIFEDVTPGNHTVTIKDIYGCGMVTFDVGVIDYPPYFTPNQDGIHDTWNIIGIEAGDPNAKIYIFDRFGKLLKQISPIGEGWNGIYNGAPLPSSDYWFRVEYTEDDVAKEFKGHFTLKR